MNNPQTVEEKAETEEWGAWKFVSDMLYNPDVSGIYPTSKCYEQIHDFVVEQKHGDRLAHKTALLEAVEKEIAIHEYLSESWTGIKLTGEKLKTNPHDEQVIAFRKAKDLINKIYE